MKTSWLKDKKQNIFMNELLKLGPAGGHDGQDWCVCPSEHKK